MLWTGKSERLKLRHHRWRRVTIVAKLTFTCLELPPTTTSTQSYSAKSPVSTGTTSVIIESGLFCAPLAHIDPRSSIQAAPNAARSGAPWQAGLGRPTARSMSRSSALPRPVCMYSICYSSSACHGAMLTTPQRGHRPQPRDHRCNPLQNGAA